MEHIRYKTAILIKRVLIYAKETSVNEAFANLVANTPLDCRI